MAVGKCLLLCYLCMFKISKEVREVILRRGSSSKSWPRSHFEKGFPIRKCIWEPPGEVREPKYTNGPFGPFGPAQKFSTCRHLRGHENTPRPIGPTTFVWFGVGVNPISEGGRGSRYPLLGFTTFPPSFCVYWSAA